ncbi:MAG: hypothetical protein HQ519_18525 [Planctomycetes bacterium]|nr:hypothetical protein [Planctomycetota bacterium]
MLRILFALLVLQAAVSQPASMLEVERGKLRPSLIEVSKRVLNYSADGDFVRAEKAANYLEPLYKEFEKSGALPPKLMLSLSQAIEKKSLGNIRESLRRLVHADVHYLLQTLGSPTLKGGLTPRTRLLMAQQDWKFLEIGLPKDEHHKKVRLAITKLFQSLVQTVPHKSNYTHAESDWLDKANGITTIILKLLDSALLPRPPDQPNPEMS